MVYCWPAVKEAPRKNDNVVRRADKNMSSFLSMIVKTNELSMLRYLVTHLILLSCFIVGLLVLNRFNIHFKYT